MSENEQYQELRDYLSGENYSDIEIDHIIAQVEEYDAGTRVDSIMDSINSGDLDIQAVIDEALKKLAD